MILPRKAVVVALALFAAGLCARPLAFAQIGGPPQGPTPNYRAIIAKSLRVKKDSDVESGTIPYFTSRGGIFAATAKIDHLEVADTIRMVQTSYYGWAWQTCIRLNLNAKPITYAVFISEGRVVDARSTVAIDDCERAHYAPLGSGPALR